jgi:C4-dicarboxylate transporter DctM subunit
MTSAILIFTFLVFLMMGVPLAISLALSTIVVLFTGDLPFTLVAQRMVTSNDSFEFMAVPFFMIAGEFMDVSGMSRRLLEFADSLVGWLIGGIGMVVCVSCMFFSAISGTNLATIAAVGPIALPQMRKLGYDDGFSAATMAASGTTGIVIPPSNAMIIYGVIAGVSIGELFLGGMGPGLLMGFSMCVLIYFTSKKRGYGTAKTFSIREVWRTFRGALLGLIMPIIVLGGIYGGIFTPTESAAVAAIYAITITLLLHRDKLTKGVALQVMKTSVISTAVVMFIVDAAGLFSWFITSERVPHDVAALFISITSSPYGIMVLINLFLLVVGCLINTSTAIIILAPILVPIVKSVGIDPVFFGIIMIVNLSIGTITPPVGADLFLAQTITGVKIETIIKQVLPFIMVLILDLAILIYIPEITMWLPNLMRN